MPHTRHSHSHSKGPHVGPSGQLGPHSRTNSTTSLPTNKRSAATAAAAGLGFTQVLAPSTKKRNDPRPHGPYRNVSSESEHSRTRGKHAHTASQSTINAQQLASTQQPAGPPSRPKVSRSTSQTLTQAELLAQANDKVNGEEDEEDEWVSSSGAVTPSEEDESDSDRARKAMFIHDSLERKSRERQSREHEAVGTPRPDKENVFVRHNGRDTPRLIERADTQETLQSSYPSHKEVIQQAPPTTTATAIVIPTKAERPPTPPPVRSQPEPHRTPTSPNPSRSKAKTRPPSIRSITSHSQHYTQPHPLIRGSSFHHSSESPQTPGPLSGPNSLAPLTSVKAPPIVTNSHTSGLPVESPPDITASLALASPTSTKVGSIKSGRRTSQSSIASVATVPANGSTASTKRASFILGPSDSGSGFSRRDVDPGRDRKASTASTASLTALSLLARHNAPSSASSNAPSQTKSTWHFPTLPSLGLAYTPAPTRPSTPPPLSLKLPPPRRSPSQEREGGRRYRNYIRRKQAHQFSEPDEEEDFEAEPEDGEEGVGEWIPQPFFGEHLTAIRWAVRANAPQAGTGAGKASAPSRGASTGVLRQSWKRVSAARAGAELAAH